MNVLSVDWDYFFPDTIQFDWGHRESPLFMDLLWTLRVHDVSLETEEPVLDILVPDKELLKNFWERVCPEEPSLLAITESHLDLFKLLEGWKDVKVFNFDAHHDICYGEKLPEKPECGSWAGHGLKEGLISKYTVIYPPWRGKCNKHVPGFFEDKVTIMTEIPNDLPLFEMVFICRSSAWTPSWSDDKWFKFIEYWKKFPIWQYKSVAPYVMKARSPDFKEAQKLKKESRQEVIRVFQKKEAVKNGKGMDA